MSANPLVDVPTATLTRSDGMVALDRPPSDRAISAAATANWLKRPAVRYARLGIQTFGSKPDTSPTIRHSNGSFEPSNNVGRPMPERPASAADQNFSTPIPMGETMPSPVMTGCRFMAGTLPGGAAFPSENPGFT